MFLSAKTQIIFPPQNQTAILSATVLFKCGVAQNENVSPEWRWIFYKNGDLSAKTHIVSHGRFRLAEFGN